MAVLYGENIYKQVKEGMSEEEAFLTVPKLWRKKAVEHYQLLLEMGEVNAKTNTTH